MTEQKFLEASWEASLEIEGVFGKVSYDENEKRLFLRLPDFNRGFKQSKYSALGDSSIIECLIPSLLKFINKDIQFVVVDSFPLNNLCVAIDYYVNSSKSIEFERFTASLVGNRNSKEHVVELLNSMGFYEGWNKAFNKSGYSVIAIDSKWLEKYSLISGVRFLSMYGREGKAIENLCGYTDSQYSEILTQHNQILFPHYIGLHSFEISSCPRNKRGRE